MENISFVGLGKLGLPLALCFANNNVKVLAIDKSPRTIHLVTEGQVPWYEKGLEEYLGLAKNITYTSSYEDVHTTDKTIILVNTPSNKKDGSFSNIYIMNVLSEICANLRAHGKTKHDFIISSTVMPGSFHNEFIPFISKSMNGMLEGGFRIAYVPDFVALGDIIHGFRNPDFVVCGASSPQFGREVKRLYERILQNEAPFHHITLQEAELAKVSLNAYITMKISFANFLAQICEQVPGVNVDNITNAIGVDKRISPHFFKGGLSFGGTCFPRDTWAFIKMADSLGIHADHIVAANKINERHKDFVYDKVVKIAGDSKNIAILGLSFKPGTHVITESASIDLAFRLVNTGYNVSVFDPIDEALQASARVLGDFVLYTNSVEMCVNGADVIVLAQDIKLPPIRHADIVDCWRLLNQNYPGIRGIGVSK